MTTAATTAPVGQTINYTQPEYYSQTGSALAGGVQDLLGNNGYINDVANNWYNDNPNQGALGQYSQYDPSKMSQFMNPYTQNVVNEQARLSNQNLTENILPGVTDTFAGTGQFGSTRNADFTARALRDQQATLAGQQGQTLFNAQQSALNQYKDWTQMGVQSGQQDYKNWLDQANYPIGALGQTSTMFQNMRSTNPASTSTSVPELTSMEKLGSIMSLMNSGLDDGAIKGLLDYIGEGALGSLAGTGTTTGTTTGGTTTGTTTGGTPTGTTTGGTTTGTTTGGTPTGTTTGGTTTGTTTAAAFGTVGNPNPAVRREEHPGYGSATYYIYGANGQKIATNPYGGKP